jgi:hypothetical protein
MAATHSSASSASSAVERRDEEPARAQPTTRVGLVIAVAAASLVVWIGLVALAATLSDTGYAVAIGMGAGVGLLAALFWGCWYVFVMYSHHEEAERRAQRAR